MRFTVLAILVVAVAAPSYAFKFELPKLPELNIPGVKLPKINLPDITDLTKPLQDAIEKAVDRATNDILRFVKSADKERAASNVDRLVDTTEALLSKVVEVSAKVPSLHEKVIEGVKRATIGLEDFRTQSKEIIASADVKTEDGLQKANAQIKKAVEKIISDINRVFAKPQPEPQPEQ